MFEMGFDVKQGKSRELQQWLSGNEEKLAAEAPQGWEYVGTYAAVQSSEKEAGDFRQLWKMDSYGAQDRFAEAMKEGGTFARLFDEMTELLDQDRHARFSTTVMRSVTDVAIWGE
jgi:hypothetical protein